MNYEELIKNAGNLMEKTGEIDSYNVAASTVDVRTLNGNAESDIAKKALNGEIRTKIPKRILESFAASPLPISEERTVPIVSSPEREMLNEDTVDGEKVIPSMTAMWNSRKKQIKEESANKANSSSQGFSPAQNMPVAASVDYSLIRQIIEGTVKDVVTKCISDMLSSEGKVYKEIKTKNGKVYKGWLSVSKE